MDINGEWGKDLGGGSHTLLYSPGDSEEKHGKLSV
jgi:hypothetical protein